MANETLLNGIDNAVTSNGNGEIAAVAVRGLLKSIVVGLGKHMACVGIAHPGTIPPTTDSNMFYIASEGGVYPNFSGLTLQNGFNILMKLNSPTWTVHSIAIDGADLGAVVQRLNEIEQGFAFVLSEFEGFKDSAEALQTWITETGTPLAAQVSNIESEVSDLAVDLDSLSGELSSVSSSLSSLSTAVTGNSEDIADIFDILRESPYSSINGNVSAVFRGQKLYVYNKGTEFTDQPRRDILRIFDGTNKTASLTRNGGYKFEAVHHVAPGDYGQTSGVLIKDTAFDEPTVYLNQSFYSRESSHRWPIVVTKAAHGKTFADIGSIWKTSANVEYTILRIVDANSFIALPQNTAVGQYSFPFMAGSTLEHVSGAVNTGTLTGITYTRAGDSANQTTPGMFGFAKVARAEVRGNGGELIPQDSEELGVFKYVDIQEEIEYLDLEEVRAAVISQKPVGGYSANPDFFGLSGVSNLFTTVSTRRLLGNGVMLTFFTVNLRKAANITAIYLGGASLTAQASQIFVPGTKPIVKGSKTYDFKSGIAPSYLTETVGILPTDWENADEAADTVIITLENGTQEIGSIDGYGYMAGAKPAMKYFQDSLVYWAPMATSKIRLPNYGADEYFQSGASVSVASYMSFTHESSFSNRLSYTTFEHAGEVYGSAYYAAPMKDIFSINSDVSGFKLETLRRSNTVSELPSVAGHRMHVQVSTPGNWGYLKFKTVGAASQKVAKASLNDYVFQKGPYKRDNDFWDFARYKTSSTIVKGFPLVQLTKTGVPILSDFVAIDPAKLYQISGAFKRNMSVAGNTIIRFGLLYFDRDKKPIPVTDHCTTPNPYGASFSNLRTSTRSASNDTLYVLPILTAMPDRSGVEPPVDFLMNPRTPVNTAYIKFYVIAENSTAPNFSILGEAGSFDMEIVNLHFVGGVGTNYVDYPDRQMLYQTSSKQIGVRNTDGTVTWFAPITPP